MAGYCENHPSTIEVRGWTVIVVAIVLASLATAVVAARTWLRLRVQRNVDSSDWMMLVALFFTVAYTIEVCIAYKLDGFDHHMCDLLPEQVIVLRKVSIVVTFYKYQIVHLLMITTIAHFLGDSARISF